MKKENSIIIGTGVIGGYLSKLLLAKKHRVIVTSRKIKKNYINYSKKNFFLKTKFFKKKKNIRYYQKI